MTLALTFLWRLSNSPANAVSTSSKGLTNSHKCNCVFFLQSMNHWLKSGVLVIFRHFSFFERGDKVQFLEETRHMEYSVPDP